MNKKIKISIIVTVTLSSLVGAGYGAWFAWDNGLIGNNPRAPIASAMEDSVRKQMIFNTNMRETSTPCINVDISNPAPEISGFTGIAPATVPGRFSITLLRQSNDRTQAGRELQLGQLDFLSTQGLFVATDSSVETDNGMLPARTYQLTWDGYAQNQLNYGNNLCLNYGKREFAKIEKIERLLEKAANLDIYEVTYSTKLTDAPTWVKTPEAIRWFPKLQQLTEVGEGHAKVIRTNDGWRSTSEMEMEISQAAKGQAMNNYMQEMMKTLTRPAPNLDEVKQLLSVQSADTNWMSANGVACLPLQLQRGGDDKPSFNNSRTSEIPPEFSVTYYDKADRKEYELKSMYRALHILAALEHAGLASMERIKPTPKKRAAKDTTQADSANGGIRYILSREASEAIGLINYGGGCIPAGRITLDLFGVQSNKGSTQIKARGIVAQTPSWALKISETLPALKSVIDNGIQMSGQLQFAQMDGEGKWRLSSIAPNFPEISYNTLPSHLTPLFSNTVAAFPNKPKIISTGVQQTPPLPAPSASPTSASFVIQPTPAPIPNQPAPYPAEGAPVHVISIYQAARAKGVPVGMQDHPEGRVTINVSEDNSILLLLAYEPIEWHIETPNGVDIKKVVALGYYEPRVTFSGGGKPEVHVSKRQDILQKMRIPLSNGFPTGTEANNLVDIATASRALTGALPKTFQAKYEAPAAGFSINNQTPNFALPAPQTATPNGPPVNLQSAFQEAVQGNRLLRGSSGAYTDAWSNRIYSAGKLYYEGTMKVTGSLSAHTHANIGLCLVRGNTIDVPSMPGGLTVIRHGEQKLYKDGDVFGIAADFDQGKLYFRVNGQWLSGTPESGNGFPLVKDKQYRACILAAGTVTGEVKRGIPQSDTGWDMNFGETKFQSPIPNGYTAFRGGN